MLKDGAQVIHDKSTKEATVKTAKQLQTGDDSCDSMWTAPIIYLLQVNYFY